MVAITFTVRRVLAYLFILLAIGAGTTVVTLPWLNKVAASGERLRTLAPRSRQIQQMYASDPAGCFRAISQLHRQHGVNSAAGCLVGVIQLAFTIWVLVAMRTYWPRMALDGAQFLWVSDITRFDIWAFVLMVASGSMAYLLSGQAKMTGLPVAAAMAGLIIFAAIIGLIAWYWQWPAYVFIFLLGRQVLQANALLLLRKFSSRGRLLDVRPDAA